MGIIHGRVGMGSAQGARPADGWMGGGSGWENLSSQTRWLIWSRQDPVALTTPTSLVTCDILPAIRIVIGQWVACILSSSPEQILLAMDGRWFRGLSPTISILDEEEKSEQQTPRCHWLDIEYLIRYRIESLVSKLAAATYCAHDALSTWISLIIC